DGPTLKVESNCHCNRPFPESVRRAGFSRILDSQWLYWVASHCRRKPTSVYATAESAPAGIWCEVVPGAKYTFPGKVCRSRIFSQPGSNRWTKLDSGVKAVTNFPREENSITCGLKGPANKTRSQELPRL